MGVSRSPFCVQLAESLLALWSTRNSSTYKSARARVESNLDDLKEGDCKLGGVGDYLFTFPIAYRRDRGCGTSTYAILSRTLWLDPLSTKGTMIDVSWYSQRPNLPLLARMARQRGIHVRMRINIGHDPESAAFNREGCPRMKAIFDVNGDIYKQRYFLFLMSDIRHQIEHIRDAYSSADVDVRVTVCSAYRLLDWNPSAPFISAGDVRCDARKGLSYASPSILHSVATVTAMPYFLDQKLRKTVFEGPTLVFVAGVEGSGHHLFSLLGRRHTSRKLYDAFMDYIRFSAWGDQSLEKNAKSRSNFIQTLRLLKLSSSNAYFGPATPGQAYVSKVFFLNTVFVDEAVNMFSYPFGGPACRMKSKARSLCQIDLFNLAYMVQEAGIDFRILHLTRSMGAAVVSTSVHRPLHRYTVPAAGFYMYTSNSMIQGALSMLDAAFTIGVSYENMMANPAEQAARIIEHIRAPPRKSVSLSD